MNIREYSMCLANATHNTEMADRYEATYNMIVAGPRRPGDELRLARLDVKIQAHDRLSFYWMRESDAYHARYYR